MATTVLSKLDIPPCPRTLILDFRDSYTANLLTLFSTLYPPPRTTNIERLQNSHQQTTASKERDEWISDKVIIVQADSLELSTYLKLVAEKQIDCVILSPGPGRADNEKIVHTPDLKHGHVIPVKHNYTSLFDRLPHMRNDPSSTTADNKGEHKAQGQVDLVAYNSLTVSWNSKNTFSGAQSGEFNSIPRQVQRAHHNARVSAETCATSTQQSIASAHGAEILCSFLHKTHAFHGSPVSFPNLSKGVIKLSPVYHGLDQDEVPESSPQAHDGAEDYAMLESTAETFASTGTRTVDSEEMFIGLIDRINSPLGQVWLDGVSTRAPTTSTIAFPSFIITYAVLTRTVTCHFLPSSTTSDSAQGVKTATLQFPTSPDGNDIDFWTWFERGQTELTRMNMTHGERWKARQPSVYCAANEEEDRKPRWKGGWVGWWGYEMKAESLGGYNRPPRKASSNDTVDACWAWCNRLVQREQDGTWTARGILGAETSKDQQIPEPQSGLSKHEMLSWLEGLGVEFGTKREGWRSWMATCRNVLANPVIASTETIPGNARMPDFECDIPADEYLEGIRRCREAIYNGDSYELTMTTQFRSLMRTAKAVSGSTSTSPEALNLYLQLRQKNPAPYSTYLCFPSVRTTILSSSPERFLRITPGGRIEMKPIKGTRARVRYPRDVAMCAEDLGRTPTEAEAISWCEEKDRQIGQALRNDGKERAENLMIVDLIRSDLQSCCTPHSVQVPKLIALETYETVHQLVTTVCGQLLDGVSEIEAVKRSFPPGKIHDWSTETSLGAASRAV
ncbi:hypothetical protein QFC24_005510 [Naganishia onofrii]|uniref:Uncharacterized protein n=1 Tax=Naganishia onofrii TaxID=1851511 RepID=A0ACC2X6Z8_9TREE|nr:hypothetical protein QFC24_005510 [Naganishia onofrii]